MPALTSERGSSMTFFIVVWAVMVMFVGLAIDMGRAYLAREKLRTAQDAAALAGAMQFRTKVRVLVSWTELIPFEFDCGNGKCVSDLREQSSKVLDFLPRSDVWENMEWSQIMHCRWAGGTRDCEGPPKTCILEEQIIDDLPSQDMVKTVAESMLDANAQGQLHWVQRNVSLDPRRGRVQVTASITVPMTIMRMFGHERVSVKWPEPAHAEMTPPVLSADYCSNATGWWMP